MKEKDKRQIPISLKKLTCIGILIILSFIVSLGCARKASEIPPTEIQMEKTAFLEESVDESQITIPQAPLRRLVIKTGTINIIVKEIGTSVKKIIKYAEDKKGWVVSSSLMEGEEIPSAKVIIRIPSEIFDEAMVYLRELAERVSYETIEGQDVTEEYVDLQSRLRNLEAAENQLLKIMERSGKISEILEVHKELVNIREQIEKTKGRIQYLEESGKFATITINLALSEELLPIPPSEKWAPKYVFLQTWKNVLGFWREFSYLLIKILVWAQVWLPLLIIIWLSKKYWRKLFGQAIERKINYKYILFLLLILVLIILFLQKC